MNELTPEPLELSIDQLESISGGDFAINVAVKAYEALGQRLMDAIHPPAPKPTMSLHMR